MTRRLRFLLPAALALVLAGCSVPLLIGQSAEQGLPMADVELTAEACSSFVVATDCLSRDHFVDLIEEGDLPSLPMQVLVAFRVPEGSTPPATLSSAIEIAEPNFIRRRSALREVLREGREADVSELARPRRRIETADVDVTFTRSDQLVEEMEDSHDDHFIGIEAPVLVPDGQKLVGYISETLEGTAVGEYEISGTFGLPEGAGGKPYAGPFEHLAFAGSRIAFDPELFGDSPFNEDRDVHCVDGPPLPWDAACPIPEGLIGVVDDIDATFASRKLDTRDLTISAGDPVTVEQGGTATVPFTIHTAGPAGDAVNLGADVSIQDGTAKPQDASWPFAATGDHAQSVTVDVPHYTEPGEYIVRLVAEAGGRSRDAFAKLVVTPRPLAVPVPEVTVERTLRTPDNLYYRRGGIPFGYICPAPAADCASSTAELFLEGEDGALTLGGFKKFTAKQDKRVETAVRAFRTTRRALRAGRTLAGLLIIRSGEAEQVRRVLVRIRRR